MRLNVKSFALSLGLVWGTLLFVITWCAIWFGIARGEVALFGILYSGFEVSPIGSVVAFGWGLGDGLVLGALFAWLYNISTDHEAFYEKLHKQQHDKEKKNKK